MHRIAFGRNEMVMIEKLLGQTRILIADDHQEVLYILRDLLEAEFDVVGAVTDGQSLLAAAEDLKPDVIVTDITMPELDGIEASELIIRQNPDSRIILLTMHNDPALAMRGFAAGVLGYVLKMRASQELSHAIHQALEGNRYISPLVKA
jgi:DNA-binding NarL/FixJ family response regulator